MATLTVKRGDTWEWPFVYKDTAGDPIDLTDCSARFHIKAKRAETPVVEASDATGEITITALSGLVTVKITPATTMAIAPGKYEADMEMTWSNGDVQSSITFVIDVVRDITV